MHLSISTEKEYTVVLRWIVQHVTGNNVCMACRTDCTDRPTTLHPDSSHIAGCLYWRLEI